MQNTTRPPNAPRRRGPSGLTQAHGRRLGQPTPPPSPCEHQPVQVAGLEVVACAECGTVAYRDPRGTVLPTVALARLFGDFELVGVLPAVHAPGQAVRLYRPSNRSRRRHLEAFPVRQWFEVDTGLWLSHDGDHLLLATRIPVEVGPAGAGPYGA